MYSSSTSFVPEFAEPRDMPNDVSHDSSDPRETRERALPNGEKRRRLRSFAIAEAPQDADDFVQSDKYPKWVRLAVILCSALGAWVVAYALVSLI